MALLLWDKKGEFAVGFGKSGREFFYTLHIERHYDKVETVVRAFAK